MLVFPSAHWFPYFPYLYNIRTEVQNTTPTYPHPHSIPSSPPYPLQVGPDIGLRSGDTGADQYSRVFISVTTPIIVKMHWENPHRCRGSPLPVLHVTQLYAYHCRRSCTGSLCLVVSIFLESPSSPFTSIKIS